jgi:hypothetical protein
VKIDMLTGPIVDLEARKKVKITMPRVRPRGNLELHAYLTDEAIDFEKSLLELDISGTRSDGQAGSASIFVPQPFTLLLMKLHAVADRADDADRDLGRHHALDVYRIVAMLTPEEYSAVHANTLLHRGSRAVQRACEIVNKFFHSTTAMGIIRLREHSLFTSAMKSEPLIDALRDLFRLP